MRLRRRRFRPYVLPKLVEGVAFDFLIGDETGRDWYDVGATDPDWPEMAFIRDRVVHEGDVVLVGGAHHGCTTILLSRWVGPAGRVVAFEPVPESHAIMQRNLELNGIRNVTAENKAVGELAGTGRVSGTSSGTLTESEGAEVPIAALDEYLPLDPTVIVLDVQGYEVAALRGASRILERLPALAIELHPHELAALGHSTDDVFAHIDPDRYELWYQPLDDEPPQPIAGPVTVEGDWAHLFALPRR